MTEPERRLMAVLAKYPEEGARLILKLAEASVGRESADAIKSFERVTMHTLDYPKRWL